MLVPIAQHSVNVDDLLTKDGKIKQEAVKWYMFTSTMTKLNDKLKDMLKELAPNHATDGTFSVSVRAADKGRMVWDDDKIAAYLAAHGENVSDFKKETKPPVYLDVDMALPPQTMRKAA